MATLQNCLIGESLSTNRAPFFDGHHFNYWKTRMVIYIKSQGLSLYRMLLTGPKIPMKNVDGVMVPKNVMEFDERDDKEIELDCKLINIFHVSMNATEFNRTTNCKSGKEIWEKLIVTHEGTTDVKDSKVTMLMREYELFEMVPNETITQMITRFTNIVNPLRMLGKNFNSGEQLRKVLLALPPEWEPKRTSIEESHNLNLMSIDELVGKLMAYEQTMKIRLEKKSTKNIAFTSTSESNVKEIKEDEEDIAFLTRRFNKFLKREQLQKHDKRDKENDWRNNVVCYECNKPGHLKNECPLNDRSERKERKDRKERRMKKNYKYSKGDKRKALAATWSDSETEDSSQSSDGDQAHFCLMAHEEKQIEVQNEISFTFEELQDAFHDLHKHCEILSNKTSSLKRENACILKDKNELLCAKEKLEKDLVELSKELKMLKDTHEKCNKNHVRHKNHTHSFDRHSERHDTKYVRCYCCDKYGHYASKCYLRRRNPPSSTRKVWVPKGTSVSNGEGLTTKWVPRNMN